MKTRGTSAGATLPELVLLLATLSILMGMSVSASTATRDGIAVRAARDGVAAAVGRARLLAPLHGGAWVDLDAGAGTATVQVPPDSVVATIDVARSGVQLVIDGVTANVTLEFDALGLGRLANRTLRFRRNAAEARLTLSTYGRPRRW